MRTSVATMLSALAFVLASTSSAHAHTTIVIVPGQMIGGGYIQAAGAAPAIQQPDQPNGVATDGTLVITNLDPAVTSLSIRCTAGACLADGTAPRAVAVAAPGQTEVSVPKPGSTHRTGTYRVDAIGTGGLSSFGIFRVTSNG